jgi:uncharacterized protein
MAPPKMFYSNSDMESDLQTMYRQMHLDGYQPDVVVGITRGGLVPSVYVSHYFNKNLKTIEVSFRDSGVKESVAGLVSLIRSGSKILLVDDICDSGETLEWIYRNVESYNPQYVSNLKTMVLIHNLSCTKFTPDYIGTEINKMEKPVWVVFPFEQRD